MTVHYGFTEDMIEKIDFRFSHVTDTMTLWYTSRLYIMSMNYKANIVNITNKATGELVYTANHIENLEGKQLFNINFFKNV